MMARQYYLPKKPIRPPKKGATPVKKAAQETSGTSAPAIFISVADIVKEFRVSGSQVYKMVRAGKLPHKRTETGRIKIRKSAVIRAFVARLKEKKARKKK